MKDCKSFSILFTKSKKKLPFGSWLIRLWTWKKYSHVAISTEIESIPMVLQSNDSKVNAEYGTYFYRKHDVVSVYELSIDRTLYYRMIEDGLKQLGKPYGTLQNFGIFLLDILRVFGIRATNPWKHGKNCSELVYLHALKRKYPDLNYDPNTIKPHHIERILLSKGHVPEVKN